MKKTTALPTTLQEAVIYFSNLNNCRSFMVDLRWPHGKIRCPRCGSSDVNYLPNARVFKCYKKHERQKFSLKVGTIFEDSPIGLDKWLPVMWMLVNCKNGVSSWEIHRAVMVTQKTAWFMLQRARLAMQDKKGEGGKLGGEVEADETFIGGKARNMHASKRAQKITGTGGMGKVAVMGLLKRHGKVRTRVVENVRKRNLQSEVREQVDTGSQLFTDAPKSYEGLESEYVHNVIAEAYARGNVHTNGLENVWSLLKRGLKGTYVSVEPFHLFRYLDEQAFRFNNRKEMNDSDRFMAVMKQAVGRRLTYKELTGKTEGMGALS